MKKISLIILNWNGHKMTLNCLKSVSKVKLKDFNLDVVVVDNGSTDGSVEHLRSVIDDQFSLFGKRQTTDNRLSITIRLIENRENLGFVGGNNKGIKYALESGADYVCLLNNDTRVDPDFLSQLVQVADSDKKIGVVGGKIYFEKGYEFHKERYKKEDLGKIIWYAGGMIDWANVYGSHRGVDEVDNGQYDETVETDFVTGCLMLVKREVFQKIGLLDEKYFLYNEDNDFCQRAKKAGFKLIYTPKAVIWHLNAGSSRSGSDLQDYFMTRNRLLFGFYWAPFRAKIALFRESVKHLLFGRKWQRVGVRDFYLGRFGKGSWN